MNRPRFVLLVTALSLLLLALMAGVAASVWADFSVAERSAAAALLGPRLPMVILLLAAVPLLVAVLLRRAFAAYAAPAVKLAEAVRVMQLANPAHRAAPEGAAEMRTLAAAVNALAAAHESLRVQLRTLAASADPARATHAGGAAVTLTALTPSDARAVYRDFDLFAQEPLPGSLADRPLASLVCTVFDTETTGPAPSQGDEIIALGAVRVAQGRLLPQESFERLVRPRRAVRPEAQAVHGIGNADLAGEPPLEDVLPAFHRFAAETVLVGHNAAFDMRLLQLAEGRTGLVFAQPVLDTLMLSAVVHPGHGEAEHRLEAIAQRLGVPVSGRHTALGDALTTAGIFVKLLPLLEAQGIHTLAQAREASQRTRYARLEY